jgi:[ribosomal protein S5]-alanine N-acetyltransferase
MLDVIETERLILRPLQADDAEMIVDLVGDYEISKNLARVPHPYHLSDAHDFLQWVKDAPEPSAFRAICVRPDRRSLQGIISYEWAQAKQNAEIGYWLAKPLWGQGVMTEAARAMVRHAFARKGLDTIVSCYFNSNPASGKVLIRAGFEVAGPCTAFSKAQGRNVDVTNVRLTRERWEAMSTK